MTTKNCIRCGKTFEASWTNPRDHVYCSSDCRIKAYAKINKSYYRDAYRKIKGGYKNKMETLLKESYNEIECPHCNKVILVLKEKKPAKVIVKAMVKVRKHRKVVTSMRHWSDAEDRTLQEQKNLGTKTKVIAEMLGRTIAAVYVRLDKLNKASRAREGIEE